MGHDRTAVMQVKAAVRRCAFENKAFAYVGSAGVGADEVALRCARHGRGKLKVADTQAGKKLDGEAFWFAAVWNDDHFLNKDCRAELGRGIPPT